MPPANERRGSARVPVKLQVRIRDLGRPNESLDELTTNIGAGGIFVETSVVFEIGTPVDLEVSAAPGGPAIRLQAEVVRVEDERGAEGSRDTPEMQTRGIALRLLGADTSEIIRLLKVARRQEAVTVDGPSPLLRQDE